MSNMEQPSPSRVVQEGKTDFYLEILGREQRHRAQVAQKISLFRRTRLVAIDSRIERFEAIIAESREADIALMEPIATPPVEETYQATDMDITSPDLMSLNNYSATDDALAVIQDS